MSTRSELRTKVETSSKRVDKETLINDGLDMALHDACIEHNFREMKVEVDLSASEDDLLEALPSDFYQLLEVRLIDGTSSYDLEVKSKTWVVERFPNIAEDSSSLPDFVYEEGGSLYFSTPLDADYTVRVSYYKLLTFTDDSTENPVPVLENYLIFSTLSWLYNSLEMERRGAFWEVKARGTPARLGGALIRAIRADNRRVAEGKKFEEANNVIEPKRDVYFIVPDEV